MTTPYYPPDTIEQVVKAAVEKSKKGAEQATTPGDRVRFELHAALADPYLRWLLAQQNAGMGPGELLSAAGTVIAWLVAQAAGASAGGDRQGTAFNAGVMVNGISFAVGDLITQMPGTFIQAEVKQ